MIDRTCRLITFLWLITSSQAWFTAPIHGIGALLFPLRNLEIVALTRQELDDISQFFVDEFWTNKVGGGSRELTQRQRKQLLQSQTAEFNSRYCNRNPSSALLVGYSGDTIVACAGVEVEKIPEDSLRGKIACRAPLMSNLVVRRSFRKRGIAEQMVAAIENFTRDNDFQECYLYVEERNPAAVRLYQKLGYKPQWRDAEAKTLLPGSDGTLRQSDTVIICMKKDLTQRKTLFSIFS
ncbi:hypothetical protein FisN_16Lh068 [Fistulifera solaris]|uniref:N-acetyltransferase domain-containing protein n=1 Tax=Fistulifera solaris TaxID=1519565 RepID=A0A1Z5KIW3_FISSO|nr:hypothetical protein FisN_16Lh068 [Fistulifera solaris]|eukprot:GAX26240.1 hypothetical protein FisN_16Lh068 [Fistulifera solaris]